MPVTIKDIATEVGLSHVTVSKVLRGTGNFAPETRERILAAADRLKYRPHALARSMREGRTGIVGLIYSAEGTSRALNSQQLVGIQEELGRRSYELMLGMLPRAALKEPGQASALLRHWMADGLLINHQIGLPDRVAELIEGEHVPAVWMNSRQPHNCVYFDDFGGASGAVDHLAMLGHRRIAYIDLSHPASWLRGNEHYSIADRHDGYVTRMLARGLRPVVWMPDAMLEKRARVAFARERFLASAAEERPTAIITYGHQQELLYMAAHEGLSVPRDLSLISFGVERLGIDDRVPTLVYQPYEQLGRLAVSKLLDRIATSASADGDIADLEAPLAVECPIHAGDTVAPPLAA
jgi:LacI family transcriptional regulator